MYMMCRCGRPIRGNSQKFMFPTLCPKCRRAERDRVDLARDRQHKKADLKKVGTDWP